MANVRRLEYVWPRIGAVQCQMASCRRRAIVIAKIAWRAPIWAKARRPSLGSLLDGTQGDAVILEGFGEAEIWTGEATIFVRRAGSGPPVLLLHGFLQAHVMWRRVAPLLARRFTVVCADLRGYGQSGCPESTLDHAPYATFRTSSSTMGPRTKEDGDASGPSPEDKP